VDGEVLPVIEPVEIGDDGIGVERVGRLKAGRRVAPGLDQRDLEVRGLRQPARQHGSRRAAADDDVVICVF
jgi:hypothetical protein